MASSKQYESSFLTFLWEKKVVCFTVEELTNIYINEYCEILKLINNKSNFEPFQTVLKSLIRSGRVSQSVNGVITINEQSESSKTNNSNDLKGIKYIGATEFMCTICNTKKSNLGSLQSHMAGRKHRIQILIMALNDNK